MAKSKSISKAASKPSAPTKAPPLAPEVRPKTIDQYKKWAESALGITYDSRAEKRYQANLTSLINAWNATAFFSDLQIAVEGLHSECKKIPRNHLLPAYVRSEFRLTEKPFSSCIDKSFRANIIDNRLWPNAPADGWVTPDTWYNAFNDIVRMTIVVSYVDQPKLLADRLVEFAADGQLECVSSSRQRDEGYYAYHLYPTKSMIVLDSNWNEYEIRSRAEVQIKTVLQSVVGNLTHAHYESRRLSPRTDGDDWKWQYQTPRFKASYLGHTLHFIESAIVDIRNAPASDD